MASRTVTFTATAAIFAGLVLSGCGSRAESLKPGSNPPGEGAGSRGGANSGDTRVNGEPQRDYTAAPGDTKQNTK